MSSSFDFPSLAAFAAALDHLPSPDPGARAAAQARNGELTKPPGSLGRLEELAQWYAGWRGTDRLKLERVQVVIFAGNHGVAGRGISAFPPEVTAQMVANFEHGGAAINQICKVFGARLTVLALDLDRPTGDIAEGPAMDEAACLSALRAGWEAVDPEADLVIPGEMGIGNTTAAAAMALALFGGQAADWAGRGTGLDTVGVARKAEAVAAAVAVNRPATPMEILRTLGGREIAAMTGAMTRARMAGIPVLLDGFIATAAAAVLARTAPRALDHCQAGHRSAEAAHGRLLDALGLDPLLALDMRLGEGSGATLALGVLQAAIACHSGMATFAEAGVAEKSG